VQRAGQPGPRFRGLDQGPDPAALDADGAGSYVAEVDPSVLADPATRRELQARRRCGRLVNALNGGDVDAYFALLEEGLPFAPAGTQGMVLVQARRPGAGPHRTMRIPMMQASVSTPLTRNTSLFGY
jgi:hypothetical protein